jgi:hypothetical protein
MKAKLLLLRSSSKHDGNVTICYAYIVMKWKHKNSVTFLSGTALQSKT